MNFDEKIMPFSYLCVLQTATNVSDIDKRKCLKEARERLTKYGFTYDVATNIIELEEGLWLERCEDSIIQTTDPQKLFDFYFNYIESGYDEEALMSELVIMTYFPMFANTAHILLKQNNNRSEEGEKAYKILGVAKNKEYEDIYRYFFDEDPYFTRHKSQIDLFIENEKELVQRQVNTMYLNLIRADEIKCHNIDLFVEEEKEKVRGRVISFPVKK